MNTRFNFLVQIALVFMVFSSTMEIVSGQFRITRNGKSVSQDGGGNDNDLPCINNDLELYLVLDENGIEDILNFDFGCELYVGLKSNLNDEIAYTKLNSISDYQFESASNINRQISESEVMEMQQDNSRGGYEESHSSGAIQTALSLDVPSLDVGCNESSDLSFEIQSFTVNLYCFDRNTNEYTEFDPCNFEDLFYFQLMDNNCSLELTFFYPVCCVALQKPNMQQQGDITNNINFEKNQVLNRSNKSYTENFMVEYKVDLRHDNDYIYCRSALNKNEVVKYDIINVSGVKFQSGELEIDEHEFRSIDISSLSDGLYIVVFRNLDEYYASKVMKF